MINPKHNYINTTRARLSALPEGAPTVAQGILKRLSGNLSALAANFMAALALLILAPSAQAKIEPPGCNGSALGIFLQADTQVAHVGDSINYSVQLFNGPFPNCQAETVTARVTTPDGVVHPLTLRRTTLNPGDSDNYPNVVRYVIRAQDLQADPGSGLSILKATALTEGVIHQNIVDSAGSAFQSLNTYVVEPCIAVTRECVAQANGTISVSGTVRNCGTVPLTNVLVVSLVGGVSTPVLGPTVLAINETRTYSTSYTPSAVCDPSTGRTVATGRDYVVLGSIITSPETVTAEASSTCQLTFTPGIAVEHDCPLVAPQLNGSFAFRSTVRNTGNITLNNVVVSNNGTAVQTIASLAPGASVVVNNSLAAAGCSINSTLTATGTSTCGQAVNATKSITCTALTSPSILVSHACPITITRAGSAVVYTGKVRNSGNVTLTNVKVVADQPVPNTVIAEIASLAPGAEQNITGSIPTAADTCSVTVRLTAAGNDACTADVVSNAVTGVCPVDTVPSIVVTQNCPAVTPAPGATFTFTGTVRNSGDVTLNNVVVRSALTGNTVLATFTQLLPGVTADYSGSATAPVSACAMTNTVTAVATDKCGSRTTQNSATLTCPVGGAGGLLVTVACPAGNPAPNSVVNYTGTVRNPGNSAVTNVKVVDGNGTTVASFASLAPGATQSFTTAVTAQAGACSVTLTLGATAIDQCSGAAIAPQTASATCDIQTTPAIVVTHDCPTGGPIIPGIATTFGGSVRNTGNVALDGVVVKQGDTILLGPTTLNPNESKPFTGSVIASTDTCTVTTTVTASGRNVCADTTVSNTSTKSCPVKSNPGLAISSECPPNATAPGGSVTATTTVRNTGDSTLNSVTVNSDRTSSRVFGPISLAPGATATFTHSFNASTTECAITEKLSASATDRCGVTVAAETIKTCPILGDGRIAIGVRCGTGAIAPGGTGAFTGTVTNTGNITLKDVSVTLANGTVVKTFATLAPGEKGNFDGTFPVPTGVCDVTVTVGVVAADKCAGIGTTSTASATCPITTTPGLRITHACPESPTLVGKTLTFSGTVENTGNVSLRNVVVLNGTTVVYGPATLAPQEKTTFFGSFIVPPTATGCTTTYTLTGSGVDVCSSKLTTAAPINAECPVLHNPSIVVTRDCPATTVEQGETLRYNGVVLNNGDVTLRNIVVTSSQTGTKQVYKISSLAPGKSAKFSGSFSVPDNCCTVTDTLTVTSTSDCSGVTVRDTTTVTCPVHFTPGISVTKVCVGDPVEIGESQEFRGVVKNTGNITLVNVNVEVIHAAGTTKVHGPIALAPGESINYRGSYVVPPDSCGNDVVVAHGRSICGDTDAHASAATSCPVITSPGIQVIKNCPEVSPVSEGEYTFTGTVYNTGNVTLTNVTVYNSRPAANTQVFHVAALQPGESKTFTATYTLSHECCEVVDTLTTRGYSKCDGLPCTHSSTAVCPMATRPALTITKSPVEGMPMYDGVARNTGDINLTNVTITAGGITLVGPIELAPGETVKFTGITDGQGTDVTVVVKGTDACKGTEIAAAANYSGGIGGEIPAAIVIQEISTSGAEVTVKWSATAGSVYRLQAADSLTAPWQNCPGDVTASGVTATKVDNNGGAQVKLYRILKVQ